MAVGDDATSAGYPLVPGTGSEDAKVRYGNRDPAGRVDAFGPNN